MPAPGALKRLACHAQPEGRVSRQIFRASAQEHGADLNFLRREAHFPRLRCDDDIQPPPVAGDDFVRDAKTRRLQARAQFRRGHVGLQNEAGVFEHIPPALDDAGDGLSTHAGDDGYVRRFFERLRAVADAEIDAASKTEAVDEAARLGKRRLGNVRQLRALAEAVQEHVRPQAAMVGADVGKARAAPGEVADRRKPRVQRYGVFRQHQSMESFSLRERLG